ncbi:hypothetical protein [Lentzea cavernae]|uniref:Uncharacterized protein n=1 Tax=Lentzea cavernae TaxID=2020703 RepID=A0ABQ3MHW2_9PSEU|nr:hypothetical protein [Lentzea cavernae]GHH47358.1 hypothetical protein GCM10017774_51470 [Lentzea cavernae]
MTDPEVAEEFAEEAGVDPTPQEVDEYREMTQPGEWRADEKMGPGGAPAPQDGDDPTGGSGA